MAVGSNRLIGHKEWAAGRKSDPTYSMSWRRSQVAAFTPKGGGTTPTEDDDMTPEQAKQLQYVYDRLTAKEINGETLPAAVRQLHRDWVATEHNRAGVPDDDEYATGRAITLLRYADGNAEMLREEVAALRAAVDEVRAAVTPPPPGS